MVMGRRGSSRPPEAKRGVESPKVPRCGDPCGTPHAPLPASDRDLALGPPSRHSRPSPSLVSRRLPLRGAPESDNAHVHAALHLPDERLLKEGRESGARRGAPLHALQLRAHPSDSAGDAGNGGGRGRSCLVNREDRRAARR